MRIKKDKHWFFIVIPLNTRERERMRMTKANRHFGKLQKQYAHTKVLALVLYWNTIEYTRKGKTEND